MKPTDVTVRILGEIRDEIRKTNERVDKLTEHVDAGFASLGHRVDGVDHRITQVEARLGTAVLGLAGKLDDVRALLRDRLGLKDHTGLK
jgi:hypothetical protein